MSTVVSPTSFESMDEFVRSLVRLGSATAFVYRTEFRTFSWSYWRVYSDALRMAAFLQAKGIRPGARLILWASNSPQWVSVFFGCILSGIVAVPIDLRSREDFVRQVGREVDASVIFRTRFKPDPGLDIPQFFVEDVDKLLIGIDAGSYRRPSIRPNGIIEILYTSGTVARSKGAILTHENIVSELRAIEPVIPAEREYRFLSLLPLSHIFEQMIGLFVPLSRDSTVVYLETLKPSSIFESLQRSRITALVVVPRMLELLRSGIRREVERRLLFRWMFPTLLSWAPTFPPPVRRLLFWPILSQLGGKLKYIVSGGAALDPELERFWDSIGVIVLQGYGLTETASAVTCNRLEARKIGSAGRVLAGQEVKIAADGEILVRGPNVTPGYYANERQTAAAFEDRWLKTGDIGQFDSDGFLFVKGRKKDVIVTAAGLNIYPEDIEAVLNRIAGVRESSVVEWKGTVHAVILLESGAEARRIVEQANRKLDPSQQIQGYTVWPFEDFPRTTTLKVRKRDLLDFLRRAEAKEQLPPAPPGPTTRLYQIIGRISPQGPGALRPDATLGLDLKLGSIDRLELISLIEQELGVDLPEEFITPETTVAQVERMIEERPGPAHRLSFPRWAVSPLTTTFRDLAQRLLLLPLLRLLLRVSIEGLENLNMIDGPVIFAPNHQSYLDAPAIAMALPRSWRLKLAVAAWAEYFEAADVEWPILILRRIEYYVAVLLLNIFPLPQRRVFRDSIKYAGELVDRGWSILIFPEGQRTTTGQMLPFKEGIGLLVSALRVPVIPVGITGLYAIYGPSKVLPSAGDVWVTFGEPLYFRDESYIEITRRVKSAVRGLVKRLPEASGPPKLS